MIAVDPEDSAVTAAGVEPVADAPEGADAPDTDAPDGGRDAAKDAAKYRRAAREAAAERDALKGRLEALQRHQVEEAAAQAGVQKPAALWAAGTTLDDCLDANGQIDPRRTQAAIETAVQALGLAVGTAPSFDGGPRQPVPVQRGWADVLRSR